TLSGNGAARSVIIRTLLVGSATLRDVPAARVVLPENTTEEGDGLLPLSGRCRDDCRTQLPIEVGRRPQASDSIGTHTIATHLPRAREDRGKPLDPLAEVDFADIEIAERIDPDGVRKRHLTGQAAASAKVSERLAALALHGPDDVVVRVGHEQILLLRVLGDDHLVGRAADGLGERADDLHRWGLDPRVQSTAAAALRG